MTTWAPNFDGDGIATPLPVGAPTGSTHFPETAIQVIDGDGVHVAWVEEVLGGYEWQRELDGSGAAGAGTMRLLRTDPLTDTITYDHRLRFWFRGVMVFESLIAPRTHQSIDQSEASGETTALGGPGTLAILSHATVDPFSLEVLEPTKRWNPGHPRYDDSTWPDTSEFCDLVVYPGTGNFYVPVPEYDGPDGDSVPWTEAPAPMAGPIGATDPYLEGVTHYRKQETGANSTTVMGRLFVSINNYGTFWLDGQPLVSLEGLYNNRNWRKINEPAAVFAVSPGEHTAYIRHVNTLGTVAESDDMGTVRCRLELVSQSGAVIDTIFESNDTWTVLEDPADEPGWTWPDVIEDAITDAASRHAASRLNDVTWTWDPGEDSDASPAVVYPEINLTTGSKVFELVAQGMEADIDVRMDSLALSLWNKGDMGATTAPTLDMGIVQLTHRVEPPVASRFIADYERGYVDADNSALISAGVYREEHVQLSPIRSRTQAQIVLNGLVDNLGRERVLYEFEMEVVTGGLVPWVDYLPGDTIELTGVDGDPVEVRLRSLKTTVDENGRVHHQGTAGDLLYDDEDRVKNWLARLSHGAVGGRTLTAMPPGSGPNIPKQPIGPPLRQTIFDRDAGAGDTSKPWTVDRDSMLREVQLDIPGGEAVDVDVEVNGVTVHTISSASGTQERDVGIEYVLDADDIITVTSTDTGFDLVVTLRLAG